MDTTAHEGAIEHDEPAHDDIAAAENEGMVAREVEASPQGDGDPREVSASE